MDNTYLFEQFVNTRIGDAFRLFPFGSIVKSGQKREITPEYARQFKLPHFKPPIKLGSHADETGAGGHIIGLEVRDDGLYAIPEWNEKGLQALKDGAYRYHSPEVAFEGGLENDSGDLMKAPLILGDALLHTPHLGERAALYSITQTEETMAEETINLPKGIWEEYIAPLFKRGELVESTLEEKEAGIDPEKFTAIEKERDEYKVQLEAIEAGKKRAALVEKFEAGIAETQAAPEMAELLADLPEDKAEAIMGEFKKLSERINVTEVTEEKGTEGGEPVDAQAAFNAEVLKYSAEHKLSYPQAFEVVKVSNAALYAEAFGKK